MCFISVHQEGLVRYDEKMSWKLVASFAAGHGLSLISGTFLEVQPFGCPQHY